jgi:ferredoxin
LNRAGDRYDRIPRQVVPTLPVTRRTGFREVEEGYTEEQARLEGSRCLWCNVETIFDSEKCILCSGCVEICPEGCLSLIPASRLRMSPEIAAVNDALGAGADMGAIVKDEARCIRCGGIWRCHSPQWNCRTDCGRRGRHQLRRDALRSSA